MSDLQNALRTGVLQQRRQKSNPFQQTFVEFATTADAAKSNNPLKQADAIKLRTGL